MEQVVRLTTDRLGSLDGLVRRHSILLPPPPRGATKRAKYATACVICPEGLHKVTMEPKYTTEHQQQWRRMVCDVHHMAAHVA